MSESIKCPICDRRLTFLGETGTETRRCVCGCKVSVKFERQQLTGWMGPALEGMADELEREEQKR